MKHFLFLFFFLFALNKTNAKEVSGYYINLSNDTIKINFKITMELFSDEINISSIQCGVMMYNEKHKKVYLKPEAIKEIHFDLESKHYKFVSLQNTLQLCQCFYSSKFLLKQIIDGDLKLYTYHLNSQSGGQSAGQTTMYSGEVNILQKKDGALFKIDYFSFKKSLSEYLSDCPELVQKIQDKIYGKDDLLKIVSDYNQNCGSTN